VATREHYLAAYETNYKFDDRFYSYGAAQFEKDRFFGFTQRYATSVGIGYSARQGRLTTFDIELGPAYRFTDFTDGTHEHNFAARGSLDMAFKVNPALTITNNSAAYVQSANSTIASTTALNAKLLGPLSGQFSYSVQYESMPPEGRRNTDTTSRASLVYSF
jgi:putative salt-induced outer membrane protein